MDGQVGGTGRCLFRSRDGHPQHARAYTAAVDESQADDVFAQSIISHGKDQNRSNDAISLLRGPDALSVLIGAFAAVAAQAFFAARCWRVRPISHCRKTNCKLTFWELVSRTGPPESRPNPLPPLDRRARPRKRRQCLWHHNRRACVSLHLPPPFAQQALDAVINHGATDATRGASPDAYENLYNLALAWLFCGAAADISISCVLLVVLRNFSRRRTDSCFPRSAVLITRLWQKKRAANAGAANAGRPGADGGLGGVSRLFLAQSLA